MSESDRAEVAAAAARLVVEEGMEYGPAKRRALRDLGLNARRTPLPDNETVEAAVREELTLFHAETQPAELAELRRIAVHWMERLAAFRPHVSGAVWRGTATRLSAIHLDLYCDDTKAAELALLDRGVDFDVATGTGPRGEPVDVLSVAERSPLLNEWVTLHLSVLDHDDLRGALRPDAQGLSWRGSLDALRRLIEAPPS
jgi:hypothetical protein